MNYNDSTCCMIAVYKEDFSSGCSSHLNDETTITMHRTGERCFKLLALIGSLSASLNKGFQQLDKSPGQTGQTIMACTVAESL